MRAALATHADDFTRFICLGGEISWQGAEVQWSKARVHWPSMPTNSGIALRIGNFRGPFNAADANGQFIIKCAQEILAEARANAVIPAEFQIDFDCADSKLYGYAVWLREMRKQLGPIPLTITCLPSWLNQREFAHLLEQVDGYVLQVHAVTLPRGAAPINLCDPEQARNAVMRAAAYRKPFRVALPTYGCALYFDREKRFVNIRAESPPGLEWEEGTTVQRVQANPAEMAALVRSWQQRHSEYLQGIIWFRLPVSSDEFNWSWVTLEQVMAGTNPEAAVGVEHRVSGDGLIEIDVLNSGAADSATPTKVTVSWTNSSVIATDALNGYERSTATSSHIELHTLAPFNIKPSERRTIAWLRLTEPAKLSLQVSR